MNSIKTDKILIEKYGQTFSIRCAELLHKQVGDKSLEHD